MPPSDGVTDAARANRSNAGKKPKRPIPAKAFQTKVKGLRKKESRAFHARLIYDAKKKFIADNANKADTQTPLIDLEDDTPGMIHSVQKQNQNEDNDLSDEDNSLPKLPMKLTKKATVQSSDGDAILHDDQMDRLGPMHDPMHPDRISERNRLKEQFKKDMLKPKGQSVPGTAPREPASFYLQPPSLVAEKLRRLREETIAAQMKQDTQIAEANLKILCERWEALSKENPPSPDTLTDEQRAVIRALRQGRIDHQRCIDLTESAQQKEMERRQAVAHAKSLETKLANFQKQLQSQQSQLHDLKTFGAGLDLSGARHEVREGLRRGAEIDTMTRQIQLDLLETQQKSVEADLTLKRLLLEREQDAAAQKKQKHKKLAEAEAEAARQREQEVIKGGVFPPGSQWSDHEEDNNDLNDPDEDSADLNDPELQHALAASKKTAREEEDIKNIEAARLSLDAQATHDAASERAINSEILIVTRFILLPFLKLPREKRERSLRR